MLTGISGSKQVRIASQTAFSLNAPAGAGASSARVSPSIADVSSRATRKMPWSVRTVTFPPSVWTISTVWPAARVAASPAGMSVAGQSLRIRWAMGSVQRTTRSAGILA